MILQIINKIDRFIEQNISYTQLLKIVHFLSKNIKKNILERLSQLFTFAFQSQVCLTISKASPEGHLTAASLIVPATPALSHLEHKKTIKELFSVLQKVYFDIFPIKY